MVSFWLDIERFYTVPHTEVFEKWERFRDIQIKYLTTGPYRFPEYEQESLGILKSK